LDKFSVVVVAAGTGTRMGTPESKQYLPLHGKPVLIHTLAVFQAIDQVERIVLVVGAADISRCELYKERYGLAKVERIVAGGKDRQESVYLGIQSLPSATEVVLVHDGVRPFVSEEQILSCWREAVRHDAAVLAVPVKDTIKIVDASRRIISTPERQSLWAVQTPQAFRLSLLKEAHERARADRFVGTDDAMLVERLGKTVRVVEGDYRNIKLTTPEDMLWANWLMERKGGADG
jgi:2-C-methyl-D-erythritol 4-phosphate cytidylyltransferase